MTSSSTSPAPLPAAPVLRMRDPGELCAALPYLIGFHPRDSLVVVAFGGPSGRRVGLTQRVDLPSPEHAPGVCGALAHNVESVVLPLLLWLASIYLRSQVATNIHPWQLEWCLWVLSTSVTSAAIGWGLRAAWPELTHRGRSGKRVRRG